MGDYTRAVALRYLVLLLLVVARMYWPVPRETEDLLLLGIIVVWIVLVQTEPAARHARRAPSPWYGWMAAHAALVHALCVTALGVVATMLEPERIPPYDPTGMAISTGVDWGRPSIFDEAVPVVVCGILSGCWAVMVGAVSRRVWGVLPPEQHLVRIRRRPRSGSTA